MQVVMRWQPDDGPQETVYVQDASMGTVEAIEAAVAVTDGTDALRIPRVSTTEDGPGHTRVFREARILGCEVRW